MKTKSIFPLFLLAGTLLTAACATPTAKQAGNNSFEWGQVPQQPDLSWADSVGSRQMPGNHVILSANSFGAVADSTVLSTEAIQKAIDSCAVIGGGTVVFQPGYYQTGALFIKSGVNLQLDKGVTLLASPYIHHYPEFRSRIAGIEMTWPAAVINIVNEKNASVSGEGTLDCRGKVFWDKYWEMRKEYEAKGLRWIVDYDCKRVRGILIERSSDITLKGFTLMRTGFWGCQILYSDYCTIDGLTINNNIGGHGPSTDGIDIDSSCNILMVIFLGVPVILFVFKEPLGNLVTKQHKKMEEGKVMFFVQAFFELFETMLSYFSNTISYVRIGAFAVSHAAMMEVVLMLSGASAGHTNWIVFVLGNVLVCGLEGLVVGIQVLRLEYYEMFSRFYKGTGREFKPFHSQSNEK